MAPDMTRSLKGVVDGVVTRHSSHSAVMSQAKTQHVLSGSETGRMSHQSGQQLSDPRLIGCKTLAHNLCAIRPAKIGDRPLEFEGREQYRSAFRAQPIGAMPASA